MNLFRRLTLALAWHREFNRVRAELECHSQLEISGDLRLNRSDIPDIAAQAADEHVAALGRQASMPRGGAGFPLPA